ncbi:MAG: hypothetical protein VR69_09335 [Peptococcaceae bacterium BRH_c4b]|nr:MAG: hypothetical protein VR69_09335 [Peptococcaceae bacterium BRH_c4b]
MSNISNEGNSIVIQYHLYELPTVQHKAGLVGLLLFIDAMAEREMYPRPEVLNVSPTSAKISFSEESLIKTFNYLYDAVLIEQAVKQKWQGEEPKKVEEIINSDGKHEKRFVYDTMQPSGNFLEIFYRDGNGIWLKLWRDMLWSVIRNSPKSRTPYKERLNKKDSSIAKKLWANFLKKCKRPTTLFLENLSSSVLVGAQSCNTELVDFTGDVVENLLLHFWQITSMVYVPRGVKIVKNKATGSLEVEREELGYVLAIPEPLDLELFVDEYKDLLRNLELNDNTFWRPKKALIDIPAEAGLEFIYRLASSKAAQKRGLRFCLSSVEIYHLERRRNNVKVHVADRIVSDRSILVAYSRLQEGKYINPLYKSQRIKNILDKKPWYEGMDILLNQYDWQFFVRVNGQTPEKIPFFGYNVLKKFSDTEKDLEVFKGDGKMKEKNEAKPLEEQLELLIYKIVQSYIWAKTDEKSEIKYKSFKDNKDENQKTKYPPEYFEARAKVCKDAFLAVRGRKSQAFLDYFTGTICSIPQYLPAEDYQLVSKALINDWEKVKTLTLLAISANS